MQSKGVFISLEGPDGSGKSSHVGFFVQALQERGFHVVQMRQPGGSKTAELMRNAVLGMKLEEPMHPRAELLLFAASRAQVVEALIKPALAEGKIVISDRFHDSAFAYQGWARNQVKEARMAEEIAHPGFYPDYTIFFDITQEESLKRLSARVKEYNRLNAEDAAFKQRCYEGYQATIVEMPDRMVVVDGMGSLEDVRGRLHKWLNDYFVPTYGHLRQFPR